MNLYEICGRNEDHPAYQNLAASNYTRQLEFLHSIIQSAVDTNSLWLSEELIKALNYHAIVALHDEAGQYRARNVDVQDRLGNVTYTPPPHEQVPGLMGDLVHEINEQWEATDSALLAAYALWRINAIHPFINGNGRTARAICYFILCVKLRGLLPGLTTLPQILGTQWRPTLVDALRHADQSNDLDPLVALVRKAINAQLS